MVAASRSGASLARGGLHEIRGAPSALPFDGGLSYDSGVKALPILHEDERLLVVAKPVGILSVPDARAGVKSVPELLAAQGIEAVAVHRLDRDVSGALLLARDEETRAKLERGFREQRVTKTYWALVVGAPRKEAGTWSLPILKEGSHARVSSAGESARTDYRLVRRVGPVSELELDLFTGRYNQIRVHAAHSGVPLVGERKYARGSDDPLRANRLALHAWKLAFDHPWSGARIEVEAPIPGELGKLVLRARTAKTGAGPRAGGAKRSTRDARARRTRRGR